MTDAFRSSHVPRRRKVGLPIWLPQARIGNGWDPLGYSRLGAAASSVTFTFPTDYKTLWLVGQILCSASNKPKVQLNGDTAGNYDFQVLTGNTTTVDGLRSVGDSGLEISDDFIAASGNALISVQITKQQTGDEALMSAGMAFFGDYATDAISIAHAACIWNNTSALMSRLDLLVSAGNMNANSVLWLLGQRGE